MAADYERELKRHILDLTSDAGSFDLLVDLRESQVISQQNTRQVQDRMRWYVDHGLRRSAMIFTSMLLQMQTRRLAPDERFNYFTSVEEAMTWLQDGGDGQRP